jgi:broad specificity phosphatase PhoE
MELHLVRHGETEANRLQLMQGISDDQELCTLNQTGKFQVLKLAQRLKHINYQKIFCSDLKRAKETAAAIVKENKVEVIHTPLLREFSFGKYELTAKDLYSSMDKALTDEQQADKDDRLNNLLSRCRLFCENLSQDDLEARILIVAHGGTNRTLIRLLLDKSSEELPNLPQANACLNILDNQQGVWKLELLNCTIHLNK